MAQTTVLPPDPHELLPPLLACLPVAYASPKPPPALLPLLTPILRQRVQLLGGTGSQSWLPLLNWDREIASRLPGVVENIQVEPHPVSGEIELEDVEEGLQYRRLDHETLHCRIVLEQFGLLPVYLWCMGDVNGWRLAELRTLEDQNDGSTWYETMKEADEAANSRQTQNARGSLEGGSNGRSDPREAAETPAGEEDDSAYWAAYDQTPGQTPMKRSPAPTHKPSSSVQAPSSSELEYFARYMNEVQPALDPEDPEEEGFGPGESTLDGNALNIQSRDVSQSAATRNLAESSPPAEIEHPRPSSSSSRESVDRLERTAQRQVQAEVGIKQHISTDIKSLFRLASSAGIDRAEFDRIVRTELDMLAMMDLDE